MLKKLDWYTIKTYFGPFLFIFSVLFFIFMVQYAWQEMDRFLGKGFGMLNILKLLFYLGLSKVQLVMPLTVLLAAIMTFGGFGENYELAAMKSTGISLGRIMLPLFVFIFSLSIGLYFFSDRLVPFAERKAKNMLFNILQTKPAVNFAPGVFITGVPGFTMKITDRYGENEKFIEGVFIHKESSPYENQQTIIAKKGIFEPAEDNRFLKLALFDGYFYEDNIQGLNNIELKRQPLQSIQFDTLIQHFDISELVESAIEKENVTDHYNFLNTVQLMDCIDTLEIENQAFYDRSLNENLSTIVQQSYMMDTTTLNQNYKLYPVKKLNQEEKDRLAYGIKSDLERDKILYQTTHEEVQSRAKFFSRHVLVLVRNFSNSLMCVAFFLIGAPLGAIIRKGGVGMPVVVAIIIFIAFYLIYMYSENLAKNAQLDPYVAAWLPLMIFMPLGLFFTYKAMTDSDLFDLNSYFQPFEKIAKKLKINAGKKEHTRYQ